MKNIKTVTGTTEQEIWPVIEADLADDDVLNYEVLINQSGRQVILTIDIDPGGGFEGGYEITELKAPVGIAHDFRFGVHDVDFIDEIGKFFGMEDVKTGYDDLDGHVIIKASDETLVRRVFEDAEVRAVFASLDDFDMGIHNRQLEGTDTELPTLELSINYGIIDPETLRKIYRAFDEVLHVIMSL
ncbi:hypothetical protein KHS38_07610 [Mucilaginibacter sp. Bleaf8]|uniref:hypothetical protein n=1 Tax=Mucilaginibacter sp. Bleaf8 TaxID=2834430 RepID=UPI001BCEA671|nr:hypothetical protein [Mucilaginibacter sp. Bleaf8]MBS7564268.1 hypothetical protein [Mucilaginibacter sp. Bleaf8]